MIRSPSFRLGLRAAAVLIALAAFVDPSIERSRYDAAVVALVEGPRPADSVAAVRVRSALQGRVRLVDGPFSGADATVLTGRSVGRLAGAGPLFVVEPEASLSIDAVIAPYAANMSGRTGLDATVGGLPPGNMATAILRSAGVASDRVDAQGTVDSSATISLAASPLERAVQLLRVEARARDGIAATADVAVPVRDARWRTFVYEGRPGWNGTFVRRALEGDPLLDVVSRSQTSRSAGTEVGAPPARLDQPGALGRFTTVVVGAADGLSVGEVSAVEQFLRGQGGSVVLLLDQPPSGAVERLLGTSGGWQRRALSTPVPLHVEGTESSVTIAGSEFVWPATLPSEASVLARVTLPATKKTAAQSVPGIWWTPVGGGRLYVVAAVDAWKFRGTDGTSFVPFWRQLVGAAAAAAIPPVRVTVEPSAVRPGAQLHLRIVERSALLSTGADAATRFPLVTLTGAGGEAHGAVAAHPTSTRGVLAARFRAPAAPGALWIRVEGAQGVDSTVVVVGPALQAPSGDDAPLLRRLAASSGGQVLPVADVGRLFGGLQGVLEPKARRGESHPMRSPWWLLPFGLLLGLEWWSRRRSGLA